jgi:serine phosphatase RsbU (regulator of sigma subunit)
MDESGEVFGTERMCESIKRACQSSEPRIIETLRADIAAFNKGRGQHDDTTALVIRCRD